MNEVVWTEFWTCLHATVYILRRLGKFAYPLNRYFSPVTLTNRIYLYKINFISCFIHFLGVKLTSFRIFIHFVVKFTSCRVFYSFYCQSNFTSCFNHFLGVKLTCKRLKCFIPLYNIYSTYIEIWLVKTIPRDIYQNIVFPSQQHRISLSTISYFPYSKFSRFNALVI
jgi:hypothetical protein